MRKIMDARYAGWAHAAALGFVLAICAPLAAAAQMSQTNPAAQQPSSQKTAPAAQGQQSGAAQAAPADKPPVNKAEEDAYKAFFNLTGQQNAEVISQGEDFLSKYTDSRYRPSVYSRLVTAYLNTNQAAKVVSIGEKAIAENPDNVDVLALLSTVIPRTVDPNSLDADQKLDEAERFARRAIQVVNSMTKPDSATEEQFTAAKNEKLGLAHFGLGLVDYYRKNFAGMVDEMDQSSKLDPTPDPLVFFLLGTGDLQLQKYDDAQAAFDRCAKAQWDPQWQKRCSDGAQRAKQAAATPPKP